MAKKKVFDDKTGLYIPTLEELGLNDSHFIGPQAISEEHFQKLISDFQFKLEVKNRAKELAKIQREEAWAKRHWYNRLDSEHKTRLIDESRKYNDWVFDRFGYSNKPSNILESYRKLQLKIKSHNFIMDPVEPFRLKQFPKYDMANDKLIGTRTQFLKLWTFVFSSRRIG